MLLLRRASGVKRQHRLHHDAREPAEQPSVLGQAAAPPERELATGIAYGAWKTQGFRKPIEFREANDEKAR
jgi:hypothetical protein